MVKNGARAYKILRQQVRQKETSHTSVPLCWRILSKFQAFLFRLPLNILLVDRDSATRVRISVLGIRKGSKKTYLFFFFICIFSLLFLSLIYSTLTRPICSHSMPYLLYSINSVQHACSNNRP